MDLNFTEVQQAFRAQVKTWLADNLPSDISEKVRLGKRLCKNDFERWNALLNKQGWLAQNWPQEHNGAAWDAVQRQIYEEEASLVYAPRLVPFGLSMLAPVLMKFGSVEQCAFFLPKILDGSHWWCQGYSEPGAGSDLASVKTSAIRDQDHYIVNGQKTWTTLGQHANWIFCLVRTDPSVKKQAGISFLVIDMNTPGITVRPIVLLDGEAEVNEVFFDDVRVPIGNLVGEENKGWTYAKYLLTHERTNLAGVGYSNAALVTLKHAASQQPWQDKTLLQSPLFAARVAKLEIDLMAMSTTNLRVVSQAAKGQAPGAESSMLKIKGSLIRQELTALLRRAMGPQALPFQNDYLNDQLSAQEDIQAISPEYAAVASPNYFNMRKLSIFGGSNEVQRSIISKAILEL